MNSLAGLDYDERGAGEVVCLVHAGVFSAWFAPLFEQPALDGFRVIRFVRGVGGDGYREVLWAQLGDDGLVEAERESAYFFADELPALAAWTFGPAEAAQVAAPALLLCGAQSRPWFHENVAVLGEMLPNVRTETLPELDHLAPLTHPAELASTIGEFVSQPAATPS
jgi:pimeloyl-ACP methyl ester carboxylesterase